MNDPPSYLVRSVCYISDMNASEVVRLVASGLPKLLDYTQYDAVLGK